MSKTDDGAREITVRSLQSTDSEAVAVLSEQLGYTSDAVAMRSRIERLAGTPERLLIGAVMGERMIGWADAFVERHLQSPDVVVIGGLVVAEDQRGRGVGRRLCGAVEDWARGLGLATVRVRSQIKREDAHRFYLRDGYRLAKTSAVFEKDVC